MLAKPPVARTNYTPTLETQDRKNQSLSHIAYEILDSFIGFIRADEPRPRSNFPPDLRHRLAKKQVGRCVYCRNQLSPHGKAFTIDHIIPVSAGGTDDEGNLQALCRTCNTLKSDHTHAEFVERIESGRSVLQPQDRPLSRKLLRQIISATDMHEDVRRRKTARFRMRLFRLLIFASLVTGSIAAGIRLLQLYPTRWDLVVIGLIVFYVALLAAIAFRAKQKGYFRWNPGRPRSARLR